MQVKAASPPGGGLAGGHAGALAQISRRLASSLVMVMVMVMAVVMMVTVVVMMVMMVMMVVVVAIVATAVLVVGGRGVRGHRGVGGRGHHVRHRARHLVRRGGRISHAAQGRHDDQHAGRHRDRQHAARGRASPPGWVDAVRDGLDELIPGCGPARSQPVLDAFSLPESPHRQSPSGWSKQIPSPSVPAGRAVSSHAGPTDQADSPTRVRRRASARESATSTAWVSISITAAI